HIKNDQQSATGINAESKEVATCNKGGHRVPPFAANSAARCTALRMRGYVPQRQILPVIAWSISSSVGLGFSRSSTAALISCPDWQYPHCGTSSSIHAC